MFLCRLKPSSTMAYCTMEREVICQLSLLTSIFGLPSVVHSAFWLRNNIFMCICVTVSDTSVVEGDSQIQMGRFISFLQVANKDFFSIITYCSLLKSRKHWSFLSLSVGRNCPVLCQDVMKWWSTLFISWLPSTTATSKVLLQKQVMLHSECSVLVGLARIPMLSKEPLCTSHADEITCMFGSVSA